MEKEREREHYRSLASERKKEKNGIAACENLDSTTSASSRPPLSPFIPFSPVGFFLHQSPSLVVDLPGFFRSVLLLIWVLSFSPLYLLHLSTLLQRKELTILLRASQCCTRAPSGSRQSARPGHGTS